MNNRKLKLEDNNKLVNVQQFLKIKKSRLKKKKIIMCHGVFDVVHPGHVRHLIYAKSKADILIVSITADKFIDKGIYRPHVPQDIRAFNLSAFEVVDFVIIDNNPEPIKNILKIKPNYFAKGFEYDSKKINPKTEEESKTMKSIGGEMLYTPGDIVYSSTKIINQALPDLSTLKLSHILKKNKLSFSQLEQTLEKFNKIKIHVVGDTIVDTYTQGSFIGGQTKTPTMSVLYESHKDYVGGAGIVSKHLRAAGANVVFSSILGNDHLKNFVLDDLKKNKIQSKIIIDPSRPTVNKNAIISSGYRLLKIDKIDNRSISNEILNKIISNIKSFKSHGIILCDFRHGIFNKSTINKIVNSIPKNVFKSADSQVASRWGNIVEFKGFDLITPNEREARFALADQDSTVGNLSSMLLEKTLSKNLIMKLGSRGIFCSKLKKSKKNNDFFSLDSFAKNIIDPVGAGDALMAYSSLALIVGESLEVAAILGSLAAAIECEKDGNIPISINDVKDRLSLLKKSLHNQ